MLINGIVVSGHGVASGDAGDPRFPAGTLALQLPIFARLGLELEDLYHGTLNISVAPLVPRPQRALTTFRDVKWHPDCPAENFSFFDMRVATIEGEPLPAYIYWPHPETKPEHFQDPHVVEILAPRLDAIIEGLAVRLWVDPARMKFEDE